MQQRIGKYELEERIAAGGQGTVYRARDTELGRIVAVKVINQPVGDDPAYLEALQREADLAVRLDHPNITATYDFQVEGDTAYIVMEYVPDSLDRHLRGDEKIPWERAVEIAAQIARALDHAHQRAVVHRDIKPQNILLTEDGTVKVSDFGIARALTYSTQSRPGTVMGTPPYMAPQQWAGVQVDGRLDQYALGITLYEMIAGSVPFQGDSMEALYVQHRESPVPPLPPELGVPVNVEIVIQRSTRKEAEDRYRSAGEMASALEADANVTPTQEEVELLESYHTVPVPAEVGGTGDPPSSIPPAPTGSRGPGGRGRIPFQWWLFGIVGVLVLVVVGIMMVTMFGGGSSGEEEKQVVIAPPPTVTPTPEVVKAVEPTPDAGFHFMVGEEYLQAGDYEKAIEKYTEAIGLDGEQGRPYMQRAYAYGSIGQYSAALDDYNRVIELDEDNGAAYNNRGVTYQRLSDFDKATEDLVKACSLNSDYCYEGLAAAPQAASEPNPTLAISLPTRVGQPDVAPTQIPEGINTPVPAPVIPTPTLSPVPSAPHGVQAALDPQGIYVIWSPPEYEGSSAIQSYTVKMFPSSIGFNASGEDRSLIIPGDYFQLGISYGFTVTAFNVQGKGYESEASNRLVFIGLPPTPAPTSTPMPTATPVSTPILPPIPFVTSIPTATPVPVPSPVPTPIPAATATPAPSTNGTPTLVPTATTPTPTPTYYDLTTSAVAENWSSVHCADVSGAGNYVSGTKVTTVYSGLQAGCSFNGWTISELSSSSDGFGQGCTGSTNECVFTMNMDLHVEYRFSYEPPTPTPTPTPTPVTHTTTQIDWAGEFKAKLGSDGLPVVAYADYQNSNMIKLAHCSNLSCSTSTKTTVVEITDNGDASKQPSLKGLTIGGDGFPVILYGLQKRINENDKWLKVVHCHDVRCTSSTTNTVDSDTYIYLSGLTGITTGGDGLPLIVYLEYGGPGQYKIAHCNDAACSDVTISNLFPGEAWGSITTGSDGLGLIAYEDGSNQLNVIHCSNVNCNATTITQIDTSAGGNGLAIAIGADGFPLIGYEKNSGPRARVAHCSNVECTSSTISSSLNTDSSIYLWSFSIGTDGLGIFAYTANDPERIRVSHCSNIQCNSASTTIVLAPGDYVYSSMVVGSDGYPLVIYTLNGNNTLYALKCGSKTCQ